MGQNRAMSDTPKSTVKLDLKRTEFGYYTFETTDTVADGDHLWWKEANVVFEIRAKMNPFLIDEMALWPGAYVTSYTLIAIADPDPLTSTDLSLELEVL